MATKSIGLTGRDYSTLAAWASYVNALTLSAPEIGEVYIDSGPVADTTVVSLTGYSGASDSNNIILRAASGQSFRDHANASTNPLRYDESFGCALKNSKASESYSGVYLFTGGYITVDGLQFLITGGNSRGIRMNGTNVLLKNSIVQSSANNNAVYASGGSGRKIQNCLILGGPSGAGGIAVEGNGITLELTNCTIGKIGSSATYGISASDGTIVLMKNTVIVNYTTETYKDGSAGWSASSANNATTTLSWNVANAGGGTSHTGVTVGTDIVSTTSGSEDFRIKAGSTKLIDTGVTAGLAYDIYGTTRPTGTAYDIGAHEFSAPVVDLSGNATLGALSASGTMASSGSDLNGSATFNALSASGTLATQPGVVTSPAFKNWSGSVLASTTIPKVTFLKVADMSVALQLANQSTNGSGVLSITNAALIPGTPYLLVTCNADGTAFGCQPVTAA